MRVKVKGIPVYKYRKILYLDKPKDTVPYKFEYKDNKTIIYVRKRKKLFTILMIAIMVMCAYLNNFVINKISSDIQYIPYVDYWNGNLYVNIGLTEDSKLPVYYKIGNVTGELKPGDYIPYIKYDGNLDKVNFEYKYFNYDWFPYYSTELTINEVSD